MLTLGAKSRVYWNINRRCWSVQQKVDGQWRVVGHGDMVDLQSCKLEVSQAGRLRVIREQKKNVHAFIYGNLFDFRPAVRNEVATGLPNLTEWAIEATQWRHVRYTPYKTDQFEEEHLLASGNWYMRRVNRADMIHMDENGKVRAKNGWWNPEAAAA